MNVVSSFHQAFIDRRNGVLARVVRDVVTERGELVEVTADWYAQDTAGNVCFRRP